MKECPILFSTPMVRAILEGRKTQTRRVIKPQPKTVLSQIAGGQYWAQDNNQDNDIKCPYGKPGDRLWVRETFAEWQLHGGHGNNWNGHEHIWGNIIYRATHNTMLKPECEGFTKWKPSIHMPRWASRITLEITDIRVERLKDITEADAKAEGAPQCLMDDEGKFYERSNGTYKTGFTGLWAHINGPDSWDQNPFVWVVCFEVIPQKAGE